MVQLTIMSSPTLEWIGKQLVRGRFGWSQKDPIVGNGGSRRMEMTGDHTIFSVHVRCISAT